MNIQRRVPPVETGLPAIAGGTPVRTRDHFLVFGAPAIGEAEIEGVVDSMRRRWIGTGPKVAAFENRFAHYKGSPHGVAVGSATAAMHLTMLALGIGPGDEVITTAMTFCSTVNVIIHAGATPVLADCECDTLNISPAHIAALITPRTKAVLVVHFAGRPCDMDAIETLCRAHKLLLIEDCAHAIEATWRGRPAGTIGVAGCFSFYATKNLTTGEGGMVVTADSDLAARVKTLALHGMSRDAWRRFSDDGYRHYAVVEAGFKYNMTDLQAAIGLAQFDKLDTMWAWREKVWRRYDEAFADLPVTLPMPPDPRTRHAYHLYTPLLDLDRLTCTRDDILHGMTLENIGVGVHYLPIHAHPFYQSFFGPAQSFPNAEYIGARTISLPLTGDIDDEAVEDVIAAFRRLIVHYRKHP
jgi:dTDP-4-amino-4,6-dideoxygalactose transaminase